jgi:hypothetical protein
MRDARKAGKKEGFQPIRLRNLIETKILLIGTVQSGTFKSGEL